MMNTKKQHIAFTGGGTGGHIQPIVSLLEYGKVQEFDLSCVFFWFGEKDSQEESAAKKIGYVRFVSLLSGKIRRYLTVRSLFQNIRDFFRVIMGFFQSLYLLKKYKIDVLFCKGGYVALPVSFAAKFLGIRVLMHESDMHAGMVNRLVARFAETVFTGFEGVFQKEEVVGQILSGQLGQRKKALIKESLNLEDKKTTILVMGGSQGAAKIFDVILGLLDKGKGGSSQFLILLGTKNSGYKKLFEKYKNVESFGFLGQKDLAYLYAMSDIAFTRGSVTSLSEQALFGIKKIIIPLPFSGGNHQFYNAIKYSELYEDIVVEQNDRLEENVAMFLEKFGGYKKNWKEVDKSLLIRAKEVIWKKLFKLDKE